MNKTPIAIAIGILIFVLAGVDFALNVSQWPSFSPAAASDAVETVQDPNLAQKLIETSPATLDYQILQRNRTTQLFEKVDLTALTDVRIYRSHLQKEGESPIVLYELHGPKGQGPLTYLAVKLALSDQIDATESLNETNEFGHSSFYFNDLNAPEDSFLLVQVQDNLYGFQFQKNGDGFDLIKTMIQTLVANS
ncbi:MAG: hypothetical protein V1760_03920 [Candidatus Peregrinibacteria bacterium]